jgi:UPF0042 nucleotide-binding protein
MTSIQFVIITGLSGAGKSEAMRSFEDMGYFCVDNLPPALVPKFAEVCAQSEGKVSKVALVIDIRGGDFFNSVFNALEFLEMNGFLYVIVYLEASTEVLVRRFKETRRRHPLAAYGEIIEGISSERKMLDGLRGRANEILDTSNLTAQQLRLRIAEIFGDSNANSGMRVTVLSFGFKYGIPLDADLVFDVRFLPNPHYVDSLEALDGNHPDVKDYVLKWSTTMRFLDKLYNLLEFLVPEYVKEGKLHLVIAIGCTGGKHRSVTVANEINHFLRDKGYSVTTQHRDIARLSAVGGTD